jgi:ABC-type nitrate/sulfonate/bicarbonate transport system substrate-binding protein
MSFTALVCSILIFSAVSSSAQTRHLHSSAGVGSNQLPMYVAKDLGLFEKYGLIVDLIVITGGARSLQALFGGSTHSANMAAMAPVRAVLSGGDIVIVGAILNKSLQKFVARGEIRKPADLRGKKIGVAGFGGSSEFGALLALREWKIPTEAVSVVPTGGGRERLLALAAGGIDATLLSYAEAALAAKKGMNVLAEMTELVPEFPDRTIMVRRSFLEKERASVKGFLQAIGEAIVMVRRDRERTVASLIKHLRIDRQLAEENYAATRDSYSFPPRIGRQGMQGILDIVQMQSGRPKSEFDMSRFVDETIIDELEKEGFFHKIAQK